MAMAFDITYNITTKMLTGTNLIHECHSLIKNKKKNLWPIQWCKKKQEHAVIRN